MDPVGAGQLVRVARTGLTLVSGCVLFLGACSSPTATPIPAPSTPKVQPVELARYYGQSIQWRNCGDADCARVVVPIDYAKPDGETLELSVTRVAATGDSLGSLFVNPGGPGGSAFDYAKAAESVLGKELRKNFDIIGVDPRGVGGSSPVKCLSDRERDELVAIDGTPAGPTEIQAVVDASGLPLAGCQANAGNLITAVGTATTARDLDVVRAVLGDPVLNFLGKSYGTYLGAVYAEEFPERVGRMVLDGVLAPDLDLIERTQGQAAGFENQVADFARDCASHDDCPFTGNPEEILTQLRAWLRSLDGQPLTSKGRDLTEGMATYAVISYLYFPAIDYPALRGALDDAVNKQDPKTLFGLLDARNARGPDGKYEDNGTDAFYAVTCLDSPYVGTQEQTKALADDWATTYPTFGESLAWGLLACAGWPAAQEPPITAIAAKGAAPVLVIGNKHDPATPGVWAERLASSLENGHLLTWQGRNHTAYGEGSECIDAAVDAFFVEGVIPAQGTICE